MNDVIESVEDYLRTIKEHKKRNVKEGNTEDFLFRGQVNDLPLVPKIARLKPHGDLFDVERRLVEEFKRINPLLLDKTGALNDWDYLTLGQQYGLPTRLLDWSNNALTALWFATDAVLAESMKSEQAIVWVLMAEKVDLELDTLQKSPFQISQTKIFRPRIIKQRINNQSGMFSIHSNESLSQKEAMNEAEHYHKKLLKLKISTNSFVDIRSDLNTLGVNAFTIFPELDGLCSFLQWKYFD
ncbi:FRG domain-containing protein [Arcticibacter sp.]|jgi:hypothetical protein|uniref:FRG domain-containing protein n=1 Tax=Arcticibacter sp. TaxID=1872630 RepID=UPI00388E6834